MGEVQQNWVKTEAAQTRSWLMLRVAGVGVHRWSPQLQASLLPTPLALRPWSLRPLWHWAWCVTSFGQWARCDETGSLGKKNASMLPLSLSLLWDCRENMPRPTWECAWAGQLKWCWGLWMQETWGGKPSGRKRSAVGQLIPRYLSEASYDQPSLSPPHSWPKTHAWAQQRPEAPC